MRVDGPTQIEAWLTTDEASFLRKHYPDHELKSDHTHRVYVVPRDIRTVTITEAAKLLGMGRSGTWKLCQRGAFESLRKVGPPDKPIYLLDVTEVLRYAEVHGGSS